MGEALKESFSLATDKQNGEFITARLWGIADTAPYLHDGRAKTLEEIWTVYGEDDKHGHVNDLTKMQLNDLVDYLKSIRSPEYNYTLQEVQQSTLVHSN
jgi:cytochrome c peroxidase